MWYVVYVATQSSTDDYDAFGTNRQRYQETTRGARQRARRSKSFLAAEAIAAYVEAESWQLDEIQAGLAELDEGRGVAYNDVSKWLLSCGRNRGKGAKSLRR